MEEFLKLININKHFSGIKALDELSLTINKGEIHCLAGENGSGKSTLIKIISGVYQPDSGEIIIDNEKITESSPLLTIEHGIQVIYQDFSLFDNLTVAENIAINSELRDKKNFVNWNKIKKIAEHAIKQLNVDIDLTVPVGSLSTSGKQLVAIARALLDNVKLLIMDEPTTALTTKEINELFKVIKGLQAQGIAILFVSHKMREMLEMSERLTVIRNGKHIISGPTSDFTESSIGEYMTGKTIQSSRFIFNEGNNSAPVIEVKDISHSDLYHNLNMKIMPGEVVGISGLLGSGRTDLALTLFGMMPHYSGEILLNNNPVSLKSVQEAIDNGIAYVPEDRLSEGLFLTQSIETNILATTYEKLVRLISYDRGKGRRKSERMINNLQIATPSGNKIVGELSGGNQQRVVLARWFLTDIKLLILNGPTVGVDIGSKAEIHKKVRELIKEQNIGVLMISDDIPELVHNCNRIIMMHKGRFTQELDSTEITEEHVSDILKGFV